MSIVGPQLNFATNSSSKNFIQVLGGGFASEDLSYRINQLADTNGNGTGDTNMLIDGDFAPTVFKLKANPSTAFGTSVVNRHLHEIRFHMVMKEFKEDAVSFCGIPALTNGLNLKITSRGTLHDVINWKTTEDWRRTWTPLTSMVDRGGCHDVVTASFEFAGETILEGQSTDEVAILVRDDFTLGGDILYFTCTFWALDVIYPDGT